MAAVDTEPRYRDEDWLREKYVDEGMTTQEIGDLCDVTKKCIWNWIDKYDIPTRGRCRRVVHERLKDEEWLESEYVDAKKSCAVIASELDVSREAVREALVRNDIDRRDSAYQTITAPSDTKKDNEWRLKVLERDGYTCQDCGDTDDEKLIAHHIVPKSEDPSKAYDVDNGVCLCRQCHAHRHRDDYYYHIVKYTVEDFSYRKAARRESRLRP